MTAYASTPVAWSMENWAAQSADNCITNAATIDSLNFHLRLQWAKKFAPRIVNKCFDSSIGYRTVFVTLSDFSPHRGECAQALEGSGGIYLQFNIQRSMRLSSDPPPPAPLLALCTCVRAFSPHPFSVSIFLSYYSFSTVRVHVCVCIW